jgi:MarR family transcriptional regulator, lower aerobic nicotinate degradation pathway regulator
MSGGGSILKLADPEQQAYRLQNQIGFILRKAHQRHVSIFTGRIDDLTPPQFAALAMLAEVGETSQNLLGQMIAMDAATAKGVVDRLKARDYVAVRPDSTDKRRLLVRLTDAGRSACDTLIPLAQSITADTLAPLSAKEGETLLRLLSRIA